MTWVFYTLPWRISKYPVLVHLILEAALYIVQWWDSVNNFHGVNFRVCNRWIPWSNKTNIFNSKTLFAVMVLNVIGHIAAAINRNSWPITGIRNIQEKNASWENDIPSHSDIWHANGWFLQSSLSRSTIYFPLHWLAVPPKSRNKEGCKH